MARSQLLTLARNLHWHGATATEIAKRLLVTEAEATELVAEAYGPPAENDPPPDRLRDEAMAIRLAWSEDQRRVRQLIATSDEMTGSVREAQRRDDFHQECRRNLEADCLQSAGSTVSFRG